MCKTKVNQCVISFLFCLDSIVTFIKCPQFGAHFWRLRQDFVLNENVMYGLYGRDGFHLNRAGVPRLKTSLVKCVDYHRRNLSLPYARGPILYNVVREEPRSTSVSASVSTSEQAGPSKPPPAQDETDVLMNTDDELDLTSDSENCGSTRKVKTS